MMEEAEAKVSAQVIMNKEVKERASFAFHSLLPFDVTILE